MNFYLSRCLPSLEQKIATNYRCKGMPLSSFLLKPMQRITRYPLLIKNVSGKYSLCVLLKYFWYLLCESLPKNNSSSCWSDPGEHPRRSCRPQPTERSSGASWGTVFSGQWGGPGERELRQAGVDPEPHPMWGPYRGKHNQTWLMSIYIKFLNNGIWSRISFTSEFVLCGSKTISHTHSSKGREHFSLKQTELDSFLLFLLSTVTTYFLPFLSSST